MRDGLAIFTALALCGCGHARGGQGQAGQAASAPEQAEEYPGDAEVPCDQVVAHIMGLADYWDSLAVQGSPIDLHLAFAFVLELGCERLSTTNRHCLMKATSAHAPLDLCGLDDDLAEAMWASLESDGVPEGQDDEVDCEELVDRWLELSMRLMSEENRRKATRLGRPFPSGRECETRPGVGACMLESQTLAEWAACGKISFPNRAVVAAVEEFAERMCACTDATCATDLHAEFEEWMIENAEASGTERDEKLVMAAVTRYMECYQKLVVP